MFCSLHAVSTDLIQDQLFVLQRIITLAIRVAQECLVQLTSKDTNRCMWNEWIQRNWLIFVIKFQIANFALNYQPKLLFLKGSRNSGWVGKISCIENVCLNSKSEEARYAIVKNSLHILGFVCSKILLLRPYLRSEHLSRATVLPCWLWSSIQSEGSPLSTHTFPW